MDALLGALPYIRLFKGKTFVLKTGGEVASDGAALRHLAEQVAALSELGIRVVLVHGGGPQITALSGRLGIETRMVDGRRVTDPGSLDAAVMAMNGSVNTAILSAFRTSNLKAIGLSGVDAAFIRARVRPPVVKDLGEGPVAVNFGEVGDIIAVDRTVLDRLLDAGFVPVVSSLAVDDGGRVLNVNADTSAAAIAAAMGAEKLFFLTGVPGILETLGDPLSLVSCLDLAGIGELETRGVLAGGMLPKVSAARDALLAGVKRVHIVGYREARSLLIEVFTNEGSGTLLVRHLSELAPAEHEPVLAVPEARG
jgi:acetylglutamate kinase